MFVPLNDVSSFFCCFAATYTLLNILKILIQSSVGISCTDVEGEIPHTHSISCNKMASSSPPSLYTKPSEDLWTEWLEPLINWLILVEENDFYEQQPVEDLFYKYQPG